MKNVYLLLFITLFTLKVLSAPQIFGTCECLCCKTYRFPFLHRPRHETIRRTFHLHLFFGLTFALFQSFELYENNTCKRVSPPRIFF
ncbi:hypothetical protein BC829DRAFT_181094 [Chytridium lagenaria]|nr:hypothetical protein BC829DRAFT_181094 [Chytridium lagenaria]